MKKILFPPLPGEKVQPYWDGHCFHVGTIISPILVYSSNFSGWSESLTKLHEIATDENHPIDRYSRIFAIDKLAESMSFNSNSAILEIGCSSGYLLNDLLNKFPNFTIIGSDVLPDHLIKLSKKIKDVPLISFDLINCPLPDGSINCVIALNVLEHIQDDSTAIKNIYSVLTKGGKFILEVPACNWLYDEYDASLQHFRRYSINNLIIKLKENGFNICYKGHLGFLIFPVFFIIKLFNRYSSRFRKSINKNEFVLKNITRTSNSKILSTLLSLDRKISKYIYLPIGIRIQIVAEKL